MGFRVISWETGERRSPVFLVCLELIIPKGQRFAIDGLLGPYWHVRGKRIRYSFQNILFLTNFHRITDRVSACRLAQSTPFHPIVPKSPQLCMIRQSYTNPRMI